MDLEDIDESFFDDLPDVEIIASSSNHLSVNPKNDISNIGTPKRDNSAIPRENAPVKLEESPDISPKMSSTTTQNISKSEPKSGKKWFPGKSEDAPKNLGLKELPVGLPMCLEDKRFVLTGTLDSITRETAQDLIQEYGGRVTGSVSSRTSFLVTGETPGESKLSKAKSLGVRIIDEDGLFDLIRSSKPKKSVSTSVSKKPIKSTQSCPSPVPSKREIKTEAVNPRTDLHGEELWVDQFKPSKFSDIIGNGTLVSKLVEFIENFNPDPSRRNSKELAVLISGPPGIGKTTTATLIAKLSGYETVEFNASDARNQTSVRDIISTVVGNRGIAEFSKKLPASHKSKIILIMDEVDGMSTGDRGGMQELIKVIKNSRIPIICICNDRSNPKVRSLSNYCLDLRFRRPTKQQIAKKLQPLIVNKGLNFDLPAFEKLVESCHSDIRQVINTAQFWSTQRSNLNYQNVKQMMEQSSKDIDLGPFDVAKEFFFRVQSGENRWIDKRLNYYFVDPSLVPLMVYDLYPSTQTPLKIELSTLEAISKAVCSFLLFKRTPSLSYFFEDRATQS